MKTKVKIPLNLLPQDVRDSLQQGIHNLLSETFPFLESVLGKDSLKPLPEVWCDAVVPFFPSDIKGEVRREVTSLSVRFSRKYRNAWSYLDKWSHSIGKATTVYSTEVDHGDGSRESWAYSALLLVEAPGYRDANIERAIRDSFERGSCTHDFDCCGCSFGGVNEATKLFVQDEEKGTSFWKVDLFGGYNL